MCMMKSAFSIYTFHWWSPFIWLWARVLSWNVQSSSRRLGYPSLKSRASSLHNLEKQGKSSPGFPFGGMEMGVSGRIGENRHPQTAREFRELDTPTPEWMHTDSKLDHRTRQGKKKQAAPRPPGWGLEGAQTQEGYLWIPKCILEPSIWSDTQRFLGSCSPPFLAIVT